MDRNRISLRDVRSEELALVASWIAADHVRHWWIDQEEAFSDLQDPGPHRRRVVLLDGRPVGYLEHEQPRLASRLMMLLVRPGYGMLQA
jgi:hypothetical protein